MSKDILQYLRETPHNTNVNVVKGMVGNGSGSGAVEMTTVFDEDITLTYELGDEYVPATGTFTGNFFNITDGVLKITFEDTNGLAAPEFNGQFQKGVVVDDSNLPFRAFMCNNVATMNRFEFILYSKLNYDDPDLQTYCQTPHRLKIEWFTI